MKITIAYRPRIKDAWRTQGHTLDNIDTALDEVRRILSATGYIDVRITKDERDDSQ